MEEDLTREKQIQEAAQEYSFDNPNGDWDADCCRYEFDYDTPCIDFKAGAKWADETLIEHLEDFVNHHTEIKDIYEFIKFYKLKE